MGKRLTIEIIKSRLLKGSRLTIIRLAAPRHDKQGKEVAMVRCKCSCGTIKNYKMANVTRGNTFSCGCLQKERVLTALLKYPNANKKILSSYHAMIGRCKNKTNEAYSLYGGAGVKVCQEWISSYAAFEKWSYENGWKEGLEIDKDILGDGKLYSPSTCKWVTGLENNQHKKNNLSVNYKGELLTLSEACRRHGVKRATIDTRMRLGMPFNVAIEEPIKDKNLNLKFIKSQK